MKNIEDEVYDEECSISSCSDSFDVSTGYDSY